MVRYNYKKLLEKDSNFARWYNNARRGSPSAADANLRRIGYVCRVFNVTTKQLSKMTPKKGFELIDDVITKLEKEGKQGEYMKAYSKALKSWFSHNGITITQKFKVPASDNSSKASQEQVPTPDMFRRVLNAADQKQKVECTLVGFSGLRIEALGDYDGKDGLKVKDLPEIKIDNKTKTVEFGKTPAMVVIRPNLSKAGHQYFTFMPDEECQYVKELLEYRMQSGEEITADSAIVVSLRYHKGWLEGRYTDKDKLYISKSGHIRTPNVSDSMRRPIRQAGFDWRPYILRAYFNTRMMSAEADRLVIRDWRVFWMGHKGDIEARYTVNKKKLPDDVIEQMRQAFARASEKFLVTMTRRDVTIDAVKAQFNRQFLEIAGYSQLELDALGDLSALSPSDINKFIQEKSKRALGLNGNSQKVIPVSELKQAITEGWEYVKDLPPNEAIIKLPY